jgi:glutamate-1-semialdehyde 2,1-aminomutase
MGVRLTETNREANLRHRALQVIPAGMYGHQSVAQLGAGYPQFFREGHGPFVVDVNGREYVDLMCSWGPIVLGHRDPVVEQAAAEQRALGDCLDGPSEQLVLLAETLVETIADADWAMVAKNGTDATTGCLTIARRHTGRAVVLAARGCYHGAAPWSTPVLDGTLPTDRAAMRYFDYNDVEDFDRAVAEAGDDLAAVLLLPFRHVEGEDQELVDPHFARHVRGVCDARGSLLILDDVRCGFRLAHGGSWEPLGVPVDLSAWSKAIANGYPMAAITGTDAVRDAAAGVFLTGSFWMNAVPMAAAVATIRHLKQIDGVSVMARAGARLRTGMLAQAEAAGLEVRYTGPDAMPYLTFVGDADHRMLQAFASEALHHGVYLHPRHNWFMSCALDDAVIDRALKATEPAFDLVAKKFGRSPLA